jgi:hypothetical protein
VRTGFGRRIFYGFAALALLSLAISLAGRWAGQTIVTGGHSADATLREIVIGNDVLAVPANMIRFENARRDGAAGRLDLYVRWPQMDGYNVAARDAFNHVDGDRTILFVSLEPRLMSRDMSSRFEPIYRRLIEDEARAGPGGLAIHRFAPASGYVDEVLAVGSRAGTTPFVMRCLAGQAAKQSLAPCERDIHVGDDLSLTYRMPAQLAAEWPAVEAAIRALAASLIQGQAGG